MLSVASHVAEGGAGIDFPPSDSFQTKTFHLDKFKLGDGSVRPAGNYSLKIRGTGRPGAVHVKVFDGRMREVGQLGGAVKGQCPGDPTKARFADKGFNSQSEVRISKQGGAQTVQVLCGRGAILEMGFPAAGK